MENLLVLQTLCADCGTVYHINHHQRAYGVTELSKLFSSCYLPRLFVFSGEKINSLALAQTTVKAALGPTAIWDKAICPTCGSHNAVSVMDDKILFPLYSMTWKLPDLYLARGLPNKSEVIVLFEQKSFLPTPPQNETQPIITLVGQSEHGRETVATQLRVNSNRLVLETTEQQTSGIKRFWLEYQQAQVLYRLPDPENLDDHLFSVPLWFTPTQVRQLSSSREYIINFDLAVLTLLNSSLGEQLQELHANSQHSQLEMQTKFAHQESVLAQQEVTLANFENLLAQQLAYLKKIHAEQRTIHTEQSTAFSSWEFRFIKAKKLLLIFLALNAAIVLLEVGILLTLILS